MRLIPLSRRTFLAAALLVSTACVGSDNLIPDEIPIENTNFAASLDVNLAASTKTPNGAYYRDIVLGTGPVVVTGQTISVRYTGWLSNGTQFDSNVNASAPLSFKTGANEVLSGFDEALVGVRVGSVRQLIIPPSLGYGQYPYGPIPGNAVLVFKVEVVSAL